MKFYAIFLSLILMSGTIAAGAPLPIITFDGDATVTGGVGAKSYGIKDGCAYSTGTNNYINIKVTPTTPIPVTTLNLIVKFYFKIEAEEEGGSANYFQITLYDASGEAEIYSNANKLMKNGEWYEGFIETGKGAIADGKRGIKMGDSISEINFMTRNTTGKSITTYVEYVDIEEGTLSSWMQPDSGIDVINSVVSQAEAAAPGAVIIIPDGVYSNVDLSIKAMGAAGNPVTIKAQTPGGVILNGTSRLHVEGDYIVVDGLYFKDAFNIRTIYFKPNSNYCRLTNTIIINGNDDGTNLDSHWVTIQGRGHEIDHNYFRYKTAYGALFDCNGPDFYVHHNYFGYFQDGLANGYETARTFDTALINERAPSNLVFEYNFFDRCDGEDEVLSIKSNGNKFRYNTFYDSAGALTIRTGNDQEIRGNLFIGGQQTSRTTGIRLMGDNVIVKDNYFFNLCEKSGAIVCEAGNPASDLSITYFPPTNVLIGNNSFINCDTAISLNRFLNSGQYRTTPGEAQIENNLMVSFAGKSSMLTAVNPIDGYSFLNNIVFGKPAGISVGGISDSNPILNKHSEFMYFPAYAGIGADPLEIAKAPKTPLDLYEDGSFIKSKIIEATEEPFDINSFVFAPLSESSYPRDKYDSGSILPLNLPISSDRVFNSSEKLIVDNTTFICPKIIAVASVSDAVGYDLKEYGMLFSNSDTELILDAQGATRVRGDALRNRLGQYGVLFYGGNVGDEYYVRPYAIFKSEGSETVLYGERMFLVLAP